MVHEFKIILLGEPGVGKTSMIHTYTTGEFNPNRKSTRVVSLMSKELTMNGRKIKLCIWDTSSQDFFKNVVPNYYDGLLLVYDVTDTATFNALSEWLKLVRRKNNEGAALVVGNKTDLLDSTVVARDAGMKFASDEYLEFMESSAKNADNVTEIFEQLSLKILETKHLVPNDEISCGSSMPSNFSCLEDAGLEISSTITFPDQSATLSTIAFPETDSEELQESNLEACPLEPDVQISSVNTNNNRTTLKNPPQSLICRENMHPCMSQAFLKNGDNNSNNHETTLKNPHQICKDNGQPSMSQEYLNNGDNNTNNHETILKTSQQICVDNGHTSMSQGYPSHGDNTNNHRKALKNLNHSSVCKENSPSDISESANLANDDDMEEIESSFVFVSFLPPVVPLPDEIPLLRVGRRRTSADSVLSLMTETEINNVKLRAKTQAP